MDASEAGLTVSQLTKVLQETTVHLKYRLPVESMPLSYRDDAASPFTRSICLPSNTMASRSTPRSANIRSLNRDRRKSARLVKTPLATETKFASGFAVRITIARRELILANSLWESRVEAAIISSLT
jgi:hypothetical protein